MIASAVTLLPEPDSPTTASTSPGFRTKLTPRTAWTTPSMVGKSTLRSLTSSRGASADSSMPTSSTLPENRTSLRRSGSAPMAALGPDAGLGRVEGIPEPVSDEVDAEHDDDEEEAREVEQPGSGRRRLLPDRHQLAEGGVGRLNAETDEREGGLGQDCPRHDQGGVDDDRADGVRQQVPEDDPAVAGTQCPGSLHVLLLPEGQEDAPHDPGDDHPPERRKDDGEVDPPVAPAPELVGEGGGGGVVGDSEHEIGGPHEDAVDPSPVEPGDGADQRAESRRERGDHEGDDDALVGPPQHPGERVVAQLVGPVGVLEAGGLGQVVGLEGVGVVPDVAAEEGQPHDDEQDEQSGDGEAVVEEPPQYHLLVAARLDGELPLGTFRPAGPDQHLPGRQAAGAGKAKILPRRHQAFSPRSVMSGSSGRGLRRAGRRTG